MEPSTSYSGSTYYLFTELMLKSYRTGMRKSNKRAIQNYLLSLNLTVRQQMDVVAIHGLWPQSDDDLPDIQPEFNQYIIQQMEEDDPETFKTFERSWFSVKNPWAGFVVALEHQWVNHGRKGFLTQEEYMFLCLQMHQQLDVEEKMKMIVNSSPYVKRKECEDGVVYHSIDVDELHFEFDKLDLPWREFSFIEGAEGLAESEIALYEIKFHVDADMQFIQSLHPEPNELPVPRNLIIYI